MRRWLPLLLLSGALVQGCAGGSSDEPGIDDDGVRLLTAARIHTLAGDAGDATANAMAWNAEGRILAVGDAQALRSRWPQAELIDAGDATVVPGLIDAHAHLMGLGYALLQVDLMGADSMD